MSPQPSLPMSSFDRLIGLFCTHLLPGMAYLILAYFSEDLLATPTNGAFAVWPAAVWPAAGVAITAIMLRGYRAGYGLFVALIIFYTSHWLDISSLSAVVRSGILALLLSSTVLAEAMGAVWLVYRLMGGFPSLVEDKQITLFLLIIGPFASALASLIANIILLAHGVIDFEHLFNNWFIWFIGDSIGAMVVVPVLLALLADKQSSLYSRKFAIVLPMTGLLLVIAVLFLLTKNYETEERRLKFIQQADQLHSNMKVRFDAGREVLFSLRSLFLSSDKVGQDDFTHFTAHVLLRYPELQALEWTPKIIQANRSKYEQTKGMPEQIQEKGEEGRLTLAAQRAFYYPVSYIAPFQENKQAFGFDIASNPKVLPVLQKARQSNEVVATAPVRLIQESASQWGVVKYLHFHHQGVDNGLSSEGVVAVVYRIGDFVNAVLKDRLDLAAQVGIELADITDGFEQVYISDIPPNQKVELLEWDREYLLGERTYLFKYWAKPEFFSAFAQLSSTLVLLSGMLFTALLGGWLLSLTGTTLRISQQVREKTASLMHEVDERRRTEQELLKVSKAVEFSPNMVLMTLPDGTIEYSSPRFTEETGFTFEDVVGQHINILYCEQSGGISYRDIWPQLISQPNWGGEMGNRKKSNMLYWAQVNIGPIYDLAGELTHYVVTLLDVTENRLIAEQMSYHASHDQLTGLVNRREFELRLQSLFQHYRSANCQHAFCFFDLDQFKVVNDTCGHVAGDELLRQVALILQEQVRANDTLARLGGDEFGILLLDCPLTKAQVVAESVRDAIAEFKFCWEQQSFNIGVSVGVAAINEHSANLTEVFKQADSACYTAKDTGRNRVYVYTQGNEMLAQREGEMRWVSEINTALEENRFVLYGQLIVPLQDKSLKPNIEILLRMIDRDGNVVPPGAFLPAAERYQLAGRIDEWVLIHAFDWLTLNFTQFSQCFGNCAINLSGVSLGDPRIKDVIISRVKNSTILPYKVKFEITETAAIANLVEAQRFITALKAYGCRFSLDDFGSGLSSFAYLKNLPVDNLKIDGMFVKGILDDELDLAMVKSINDIGHVMHKTTIAEFVENDEICEVLRKIGVDYGQGYGLGYPEPLDKLLQQMSGDKFS